MTLVITVFGGVGAQGSSVVKALLQRKGKYTVRVATRDVKSEKATALAAQGVELVNAAYDDYPSVQAAVKGAYGVWFITSIWEVKDPAKEIAQGLNVAKACKEAGVQHLVFSSLGSPREYGIDLPAFEDKVDIENIIRGLGIPHTFVNVAWYLNNLLSFSAPKKFDPNGPYVLAIPIGPHGLTVINNADVGEIFARIFDNKEAYLNKKIGIASQKVKSTDEIAATFSEVFAPVKFVASVLLTKSTKKATESWGPTMYNMYNYYAKSQVSGFDVDLTLSLNPNAQTLKQFLTENKSKFQFETFYL